MLKAGKIETLAVPDLAAIIEGANGNESIIVNKEALFKVQSRQAQRRIVCNL